MTNLIGYNNTEEERISDWYLLRMLRESKKHLENTNPKKYKLQIKEYNKMYKNTLKEYIKEAA